MKLNFLSALTSLKNTLPERVGRDVLTNPSSQAGRVVGQNADQFGSIGSRAGSEVISPASSGGSVVGRGLSPSSSDLGREIGERGPQIPFPERVGRNLNR
jgi:hypothetical protein